MHMTPFEDPTQVLFTEHSDRHPLVVGDRDIDGDHDRTGRLAHTPRRNLSLFGGFLLFLPRCSGSPAEGKLYESRDTTRSPHKFTLPHV